MLARKLCPLLALAAACDCGGGDDGLRDVAPDLVISAERVDFQEVTVGDLRVRSLTIENQGELVLHISTATLAFPGGEVTMDAVPRELAPSQKVELLLTYSPVDVGEDLGTFTIEGDDGKGLRTVAIRGVGVRGGVEIAHEGDSCGGTGGSIAFGAIAPGTTARRTITIRSTGNAPIKLLSAVREPGTTTEFAVAEVAETVIAAGSAFELEATYAPIDGGADSGALILTTDVAERSSIRIPVCGEGVAPALCATPAVVDFGGVAENTRASRTVKLESCGRLPVELTAVTLANDAAHPTSTAFTLSATPNGLPRTLMPGESVDAVVDYLPPDLLAHGGWLRAASSAAGVPELFVELKGRGAMPCSIAVLPARLDFQQVDPGMTRTMTALVTNEGASSCTLTAATITAGAPEFTTPPLAMPVTLGPGGVHTVSVTYGPALGAMGAHTGVLTLDANGSLHTVDLSGTTELVEGCQLEVVPGAVNFGSVQLGSIKSEGMMVNNISSEPCTIRRVELAPGSDPGFNNTSSNFGLVFPNRGKQLTVTFIPQHAGPARGELIVTTNDVDTPEFRVPLFGTTANTGICVAPRLLPFGPAAGLETLDFTITACGGTSVTVTALDFTTADAEFSLQSPPALPFTLAAGAQQRVTAAYRPADMTGDTAILTVRSNDPVDPAITVEMTGGPETVPVTAGRFLYYWSIQGIGGDVMRVPLQGNTTPISFWGPRSGKQCTGCHYVSPDGRYVALIEFGGSVSFKIIDTTQNVALNLPPDLARQGVSYISWRPNVNATPPYQFAFDAPSSVNSQQTSIHIGSIFGGYIGELNGTAQNNLSAKMPTWSRNGVIAFVQGGMQSSTMGGAGGFTGPTDIVTIPETGGTITPLAGASANGFANYYPQYSPDGRWLAFTQSRSAQSTIAATDAVVKLAPAMMSGGILDLTSANSPTGASSYPTWSVDGRFLSFSSNRPGGAGDWDIYLSPIDPATGADGAAQPLTSANTPAFEHSAQWSP